MRLLSFVKVSRNAMEDIAKATLAKLIQIALMTGRLAPATSALIHARN